LSIREPYAEMILFGEKTIETRSWQTHYRGDLLVCVSKTPVYPLSGMAICVVNLVDCRPMTKDDETFACCNYEPGLYAWVIQDVRKIRMFPVTGQLSLFDVDDNLIRGQ